MAHKRTVDGDRLVIADESGAARLSIRETLEDQTVTFQLSGSITMELAHDFEDELTCVATVHSRIVVDFSGVDSISSAGLKALLSIQQIFDSRPGSMLRLRSLSAPVEKTFQELGFQDLFEIES